MTMEYISKESIVVLKSDFQDSYQLLWNENSSWKRVTITKIYVHPGKTNNRHSHDTSEQIWVALSGTGVLLLENEKTKVFSEGDVVRFVEGEIHGVTNQTDHEFNYLSNTSPGVNFRYAYEPQKDF